MYDPFATESSVRALLPIHAWNAMKYEKTVAPKTSCKMPLSSISRIEKIRRYVVKKFDDMCLSLVTKNYFSGWCLRSVFALRRHRPTLAIRHSGTCGRRAAV